MFYHPLCQLTSRQTPSTLRNIPHAHAVMCSFSYVQYANKQVSVFKPALKRLPLDCMMETQTEEQVS